jgi:eukaryotic-like serine/threonine-protein kinase
MACGRRTREPVESQTLVQGRHPPGHESRVQQPHAPAVVLGRYRLLERLGAGGFGVVWRAHDELLDREVAVKRIPLDPQEDSERASREALASARLAHPAIVALYEACPAPDAFYLISELVHGDTLALLIAADQLDDADVLRIGIALCGALTHAHSRGVVHRDVKPQNVLIPSDPGVAAQMPEALGGVAKLTDFGGARLSGQEVLTRTGDVLGTLAYMAPEQSEGREVGEAADLYSLALVLFEALCGVNPVRGSSPAETVRRIGRPVTPLARMRRDLPRALTVALDRCLLAAADQRGSLTQLREALEQALVHEHAPTRRIARRRKPPPAQGHAATTSAATDFDPDPRPAPPGEIAADPRYPGAGPRLPRGVLVGCTLALSVWLAASGRPGTALLALGALAPLLLLPLDRRSPGGSAGWLLCLLAPLLGLIGLAGAFPAVAGQARRWQMRASLGALGYWWLVLAEQLLSRHLWLGPAAGTPPIAAWEGSVQNAATHVVWPVLGPGVLLGATLWALAAVLLPLVVRGRSAALDVVGATVWSAALIAVAPAVDSGLSAHALHVSPRGAVLGAVLGGVLAVAARALRGPV